MGGVFIFGGDYGTRTCDLLRVKQAARIFFFTLGSQCQKALAPLCFFIFHQHKPALCHPFGPLAFYAFHYNPKGVSETRGEG